MDGGDLGLLLAQWGCGEPAGGGESNAAMMTGGSMSLDEAITLAGFASLDALVEWSATANDDAVESMGWWLVCLTIGGDE